VICNASPAALEMSELLDLVLEAHGGLARWKELTTLSAHLAQGGVFWAMKGKAGMLDEVDVKIELHRQWTSHSPFGAPGRHTAVTPERAAIETDAGIVLEELRDPRASFAGHTLQTPWTDVQLAYFVGYAIWNYLTLPFTFTRDGFELAELSAWQENGVTLRRLQATFPSDVATHCRVQTFYFSADGLLRRHDYELDISPGAPAVHYLSGHTVVHGITVATRHRIYVRDADLGHRPEPLVLSIDISNIEIK
jgi:hypothetical protein